VVQELVGGFLDPRTETLINGMLSSGAAEPAVINAAVAYERDLT
jgi:hypothetical protein